jgi:alpha-L-fucosidase 2
MRGTFSAVKCIVVIVLLTFIRSVAATHSFDQSTGMLSVDFGRYLSKHNIVFNSPVTDFHNAQTVGNGRAGAMVWSSKGITLQVSNVDASEQSCFSSGWVTLSTLPGMDTGYAAFQQYLSMYDGTVTVRWDNNRTVTIFGSPVSEALGIHVEDGRANIKSVTLTVSLWDPATQMTSTGGWNSMAANVPDINTWKTVAPYANAASAGLSRGQTDANNFGYTLAATVEGAPFTTRQVDGRTVQISITPSASYTVWIANTSRMNAANHNSVDAAATLLSTVKTAGYAATLASFTNWWHGFWKKSFVQYSNATGDADYCETFYCLATYLVASGAYGTYPFHFINGVYKSNADMGIHWSGAYWYWNQRDVYNSFLASNHPDVMSGLYRLYTRVLPALKTLTQSRFSVDGAWTPETMGFNGDATFTTTSTYTDRIYTTGAEVASNMFMRACYTNDSVFLKDTAYPYMRETAKFMAAKLSYDATARQYYMANSNAHETYWGVKNAITDLAAVRSLFPQVIRVSRALNLDPSLRQRWQGILDSLVPYKTETYNGGLRYLAYDPPAVQQNNGENITCELAWPYDISGVGRPDFQIAVNSWNSRPNPYSNVWSPDAIQAARLGMGDNAFSGMKRMLAAYQNYANGFTNNTNGVFEYIGVHPIAVNESLLHGYCDTIRVFPAPPGDATFNGKFTLAAKGGFLVSSEKESGEIKYAGILSRSGGQVTLANPWPGNQVQARACSDNSIISTTSGDMVSFSTSAGGVYVVERTAKKLDSYTFTTVTAPANGSAKTMTYNGTTCTLGSGQGAPVGISVPPKALPQLTPRFIFKSAGARIIIPQASEATPFRVSVYTLAGKLLCVLRANNANVEIRGFADQLHIIKCEALGR